jgi:hypothetical protein
LLAAGGLRSYLAGERRELQGAIAQLGERYNGIVEVTGSIPVGSTNQMRGLVDDHRAVSFFQVTMGNRSG